MENSQRAPVRSWAPVTQPDEFAAEIILLAAHFDTRSTTISQDADDVRNWKNGNVIVEFVSRTKTNRVVFVVDWNESNGSSEVHWPQAINSQAAIIYVASAKWIGYPGKHDCRSCWSELEERKLMNGMWRDWMMDKCASTVWNNGLLKAQQWLCSRFSIYSKCLRFGLMRDCWIVHDDVVPMYTCTCLFSLPCSARRQYILHNW